MSHITELVHDRIEPTILRFSQVMNRTLPDTVRRAAKGVTRRVIDITPPAHEGITGAAAYRFGRKKIKSDLNSVLAPVKLKGKRVITVVFGHPLKKPIVIKTAEKYIDVAATYRQHRSFRKNGVGARARNLKGAKYFVDVRKFNRLLKEKEGNVGRLASGWSSAAAALDVPLQNWISRHGRSRGLISFDLLSSRMRITVTSRPPPGLPANVHFELNRRIGYAIRYQAGAMKREIDYMMFKKARDVGIKTRNFDAIVPEGMNGRSDN